jgi:hypothetical protein
MDLFGGNNDDAPKRGKAAIKSSRSSRASRDSSPAPASVGAGAPLAARMRPRTLDDYVRKVTLAVRRESFNFNLVRLNENNFLQTLREKLSWGLDTRN